jgi:hypothetical protein
LGERSRELTCSADKLTWQVPSATLGALPSGGRVSHDEPMTESNPLTPLVRGNLDSMKELQRLLKQRGIQSEVRRPGGKECGSG